MGTAVKPKPGSDSIDAYVAPKPRTLRVGLLGCGVVGSEVARSLLQGDAFGDVTPLNRVAVAHPEKQRLVDLPRGIVSDDALSIVKDPDIDIVVELIGGEVLPASLIRQALVEGKTVVTANKEVVAGYGAEFAALSREHGAGFYFEGAVGGAVPMVAAVSEALAGDGLRGFHGILNGTTNFILTQVSEGKGTVEEAVSLAQSLGYAEADPGADLSGADAVRKAAILASIAFKTAVSPQHVFARGIEGLSTEDVVGARRLGFELKLLASASVYGDHLDVAVEPCAISRGHPLAAVSGSTNRLVLDCELSGRLVFEGAGAGGRETAAAVLSDLRRAAVGAPAPDLVSELGAPKVAAPRDHPARFVARCLTSDPGAGEIIAGCLFGFGFGVEQLDRSNPGEVALLTSIGERGCIQRALGTLEERGIACLSLIKVFDDPASMVQRVLAT